MSKINCEIKPYTISTIFKLWRLQSVQNKNAGTKYVRVAKDTTGRNKVKKIFYIKQNFIVTKININTKNLV